MNILTRDFAMLNYQKAIRLADKMLLPKNTLDFFSGAVNTVLPSFMQKTVLESTMSLGLSISNNITNSEKIRNFVENDNSNTIRLTFPNLDFNCGYPSKENKV
jgi:hypothetical protein